MSVAKKILAIVSVFAFFVAAIGFGGGGKAYAKSLKVLKVGTNIGFAPFEFKSGNNSEPEGFDVDLIKAVAAKMNYRVEFSNYVFDDLIGALNKKEIDVVISSIFINDERKAQIAFSDPYFNSGLAILVNANSGINSLADLEGKTICVETGTTGVDIANALGNAKVIEFYNVSDKFSMLTDGTADAIITDRPVIEYFLHSNKNISGLKLLDKNLTQEKYGIGVRKTDKKLLKEINSALKFLKTSGEYDKIYAKWFSI